MSLNITYARDLKVNCSTPIAFGLYEGGVTNLVSPPGKGKTTLALCYMASIALGMPLFGEPFRAEPKPILYCDAENQRTVGEKVEKITGLELASISDNLGFIHDVCDLTKPEGQRHLEETIIEAGARVVVVDTLSSWFMATEQNSNSEASLYMGWEKRVAAATGCCFVNLHQTGKPREGGGNPEFAGMGMGATNICGVADVSLSLTVHDIPVGQDEGRRGIVQLWGRKDRIGNLTGKSMYLAMNGEDGFAIADEAAWRRAGRVTAGSTESGQPSRPSVDGAIVNVLLAGGTQNQASIITALDGGEYGTFGESAIKSGLNRLTGCGEVGKDGGGRGKSVLYSLVPRVEAA